MSVPSGPVLANNFARNGPLYALIKYSYEWDKN